MTQVSEVIVTWTPEASGRVQSIQIQSRIAGVAEWTEQAAAFDHTVGRFRFTSNAPATQVEVRVRYRMDSGVYSAWNNGNIKTAGTAIVYGTLTGLPTSLSQISAAEGNKLTSIQAGATVGASVGSNLKNADGTTITSLENGATRGSPDGTMVGSIAVVDLVKNGKLADTAFENGTVVPKAFPSLPALTGYSGPSIIYVGGDLYRLKVGAWSKEVDGKDILVGSIQSGQLASGAVTTRVLAVGNPDNIVPDSDFNDDTFWATYPTGDARVRTADLGFIRFKRGLTITPNGDIDVYSRFFPVEPGASYRVTIGVDLSGDFSGRFTPMIHMPGFQWRSLRRPIGIDPATTDAADVFTQAGYSNYTDTVIDNPLGNNVTQWQFRFLGGWTGTVRFSVRIVRISDTTLIRDGSIATRHVVTDGLDAKVLRANTTLSDTIIVGGTTLATQRAAALGSANNSWYCIDSRFYEAAGNRVTKLFSNSWDTSSYTRESFVGSCVMTGRLATPNTFIGITDNRSNGNYGLFNYSMHRSGERLQIYESGGMVADLGDISTYNLPEFPVSVVYDGRSVRYYANTTLVRDIPVGASRFFAGAVGIFDIGNYVDRLSFIQGSDASLARSDPAQRINEGVTTVHGGKITTDTLDAIAIKSHTIDVQQLKIKGVDVTNLNAVTMSREGTSTWTGNITPSSGQTITVPFSLTLNDVKPQGRFLLEYSASVQTNAGTQSVQTRNGKPYYTNYIGDGGLLVRAQDNQGNTYYPGANQSQPILASTPFNANFVATVSMGNYNSGIIDDGDYYRQEVSAYYTVSAIRLHATWLGI